MKVLKDLAMQIAGDESPRQREDLCKLPMAGLCLAGVRNNSGASVARES